MTQQNENLSAFVDGEHDGQFNLSDVLNDSAMAGKWQRYHLMRDTLRKEMPSELNLDLSASIAAALELEPTILAPKRSWRDLPVVAQVVPFARQAGQLAVAASVAVAVIIGVQNYNQPEQQLQPYTSAPTFGVAGGMSPVSLEQTRVLPQENMMEQRRSINAYLTDHQQQMRLKTIQLQKQAEQQEKLELEQTSR